MTSKDFFFFFLLRSLQDLFILFMGFSRQEYWSGLSFPSPVDHILSELLNCGVGENSWESLGLQGDQTSQSLRKSTLNVHWKDWCWSWSSNIWATWCEELTPWKRPWCWERLKVGRKVDGRGWNGWMASPTWWTEFEQALGVGDGQGSLECCSSSGIKELDMTELNWSAGS